MINEFNPCGAPRENVTLVLVSLPHDGIATQLQAEIDGVTYHAFPGTMRGDWVPLIWFEGTTHEGYNLRSDIEKWGL